MASFRGHISFGAILGMVAVVCAFVYGVLTDPLLLALLFAVTVVGSFVPDVDSDSSLPFYIIFGAVCVSIAGAVLGYALKEYMGDLRYVVGLPLGTLLFMWYVVGAVFKKFTHHRGIMHSIPVALIVALVGFFISEKLGAGAGIALLFAGALGVGFISHLVLDELNSFVNLDGSPFRPKRSLGSALKFVAHPAWVTISVYALLVLLLYHSSIFQLL